MRLKGKGFKRGLEVRTESTNVTVLETRYEAPTRLAFLARIKDGHMLQDESEEKASQIAKRLKAEFRLHGESEPSEPFSITLIRCSIKDMSIIPAGAFRFGSDAGAPHERPEREIELPEFACALTEVSNAEYLEFLNYIQESGDHSLCHPDEDPQHSHVPDRWDDASLRAPAMPVTGVDWFDAYAYAAWKGWRLPTEEEWEKAARGTEGASFPWGEEEHLAYAVAAGSGLAIQPVTTRPTGRGKYGLYNAAGNVWEWTASEGPGAGQVIIRGGSYRTELRGCRTFVRNWLDRTARRDDVGFRCVAEPENREEKKEKKGGRKESRSYVAPSVLSDVESSDILRQPMRKVSK